LTDIERRKSLGKDLKNGEKLRIEWSEHQKSAENGKGIESRKVFRGYGLEIVAKCRIGGEAEKIIFSPFPRFIIPCCMDDEHVTNRSEPGFKEHVLNELKEFKRSMKDLIFGKKIRNFKVLDPLTTMYGDGEGDGSKKGY
jgi:hypothetical protein